MITYPTIPLMKILYITILVVLIFVLIACICALPYIWKDKDIGTSTKLVFSFASVLSIFMCCVGLFVVICEIINIF